MTVLFIGVSSSSIPAQTPSTTPSTPPRVQTKQPQHQSKQPQAQPNVTMATWDATTGTLIGITKEQFDSMGLGKMTDVEYLAFMFWASTKQEIVRKEALASQPTYSCGRPSMEARDYEKVKIYLMIQDATPAELASRIRQNLRAISDVQVVFSGEDADLILNIVGYSIETTLNQKTGYATSIVTSDPCVSKLGNQQSKFAMLDNSYLQTGADAVKLAESITTTLDAGDIEAARKNNAAIIQLLKDNKK